MKTKTQTKAGALNHNQVKSPTKIKTRVKAGALNHNQTRR
jgi:hypothetical protein